jgi:hypothetical protein
VRSDFPGAAGIPRQLDHVPFDLNRVSPLVIAGLNPAIHPQKTLRRPCRNGFDCGKSAWMRGSSPRMTKETVRIRMESALERDEFRLDRCGSANSSAMERLRINIYVLYIFGSKRYRKSNNNSLMRKMLRRRELFPAVKAVLTATLRKGHRDLPVFFDELNDAFEAHDAEEYGSIAGAMRALLARHDGKDEAELYPLAQTR